MDVKSKELQHVSEQLRTKSLELETTTATLRRAEESVAALRLEVNSQRDLLSRCKEEVPCKALLCVLLLLMLRLLLCTESSRSDSAPCMASC